MKDLIERLEKAEAGSRELDAAIESALGFWKAAFYDLTNVDGPECWEDGATWSGNGRTHRSPDYTTSLDAALALAERVLPGWDWTVTQDRHTCCSWAAVYPRGYDNERPAYTGETAVLALCIAILKAKETA